MFDPTIYDNLKVVLEGKLYDWDAEGDALVVGRSDRVDLADLSRQFAMELQLPEREGRLKLRLSAGLADFAGELRRLRLAGDEPGSRLELVFTIPIGRADRWEAAQSHLEPEWGNIADIEHECKLRLNRGGAPDDGAYIIRLRLRDKINESDIDGIDEFLERLLATFRRLTD